MLPAASRQHNQRGSQLLTPFSRQKRLSVLDTMGLLDCLAVSWVAKECVKRPNVEESWRVILNVSKFKLIYVKCRCILQWTDIMTKQFMFWKFKRKSAHFVGANPAKEREWWFWFRKTANSRADHVLTLTEHPGRQLGLGSELSTNCYNLRADQADSSEWNYCPSWRCHSRRASYVYRGASSWGGLTSSANCNPTWQRKNRAAQIGDTLIFSLLCIIWALRLTEDFHRKKEANVFWLIWYMGFGIINWKKIKFLWLYLLLEFVEKFMMVNTQITKEKT